MTVNEWVKDFRSFVNELQMPRDDYKGIMEYIDDAITMLKEQEEKMEHLNNITLEYEKEVFRLQTLLKAQDAVEPINSYGTFRCGNCEHIVGYDDGHWHGYRNNFCSECGKAVKWE